MIIPNVADNIDRFMKKYIITALFLIFTVLQVSAQDAKTLFLSAPDSLTPLLTADNKADFIDFLKSKMKAEVKNVFQKKSEMTDLTNDYISIRMSEESEWKMKVLPVNDSTKVICLITTVSGPVADSHIRFFNSKWKEIPAEQFIKLPSMDNFFTAPTTTNDSILNKYQEARLLADILFYSANFSKDDYSLTVTFTTPDFADKDSADKIRLFARKNIIYRWNKGKYEVGNPLS
jgi:hypothetical protein